MENLISKIIKEARTKKKWTQEQLAKELDIVQSYSSKLESGTVPPSDNLCIEIAKKLGLNKPSFLLLARKQRNSVEISRYLFSYPLEKIPREVKEFLIIYEALNDTEKNEMKNILSFMTEHANMEYGPC